MRQDNPPKTTPLQAGRLDTGKVFDALNNRFRRQIIRTLAINGKKTAREVSAGSGQRRHTYLKHFSVLRDAGIIVQVENPADRRQPLHALAPQIAVSSTADGTTVDLGCWSVRFTSGQPKPGVS